MPTRHRKILFAIAPAPTHSIEMLFQPDWMMEYPWRFLEIHQFNLLMLCLIISALMKPHPCLLGLMDITMMFVVSSLKGRPILLSALLYQMSIGVMLVHTGMYIDGIRNWTMKLICQHFATSPTIDCTVFVRHNDTLTLSALTQWFGFGSEITVFHAAMPQFTVLFGTIIVTLVRYVQKRNRLRDSLFDFPDGSFIYTQPRYSLMFPTKAIIQQDKSPNNQRKSGPKSPEYLMDLPAYEHVDKTSKTFAKYLANFFFHRFGLEVIIGTIILIASFRVDCIALIYILISCLCIFTKRKNLAKMWKLPMLNVAVIIGIEYLYWMGLPSLGRASENVRLLIDKGLLNIDKKIIFADCVLFILLKCQSQQFAAETSNSVSLYAGNNRNEAHNYRIFDFTESLRNPIDLIKRFLFTHGLVLTILSLYVAGTISSSVFSLIYLIYSFLLLYVGTDLLLYERKKLRRIWTLVLITCLVIIFLKISLYTLSCAFANRLLSVISGYRCHKHFSNGSCQLICFVESVGIFLRSILGDRKRDDRPLSKSKILIDAFCLIFVVIQKRIFDSELFQLVVADLRAVSQLTTEGARIYNELIAKRLKARYDVEQEKINEMSTRLEQIKREQADTCIELKRTTSFRKIAKRKMVELVGRSSNSQSFANESKKSTISIQFDYDHSPSNSDYLSARGDDRSEILFQRTLDPLTNGFKSKIYPSPMIRKMKLIYKTIANRAIDYLKEESYVLIRIDEDLAQKKFKIKIAEKRNSTSTECLSPKRSSLLHDLIQCLYFYVASNSAGICYALMTLSHTISGSILSLPLPFLAFVWGMICIPRPPSIFWTIVIGYTQATILIKYLIKFTFSHWEVLNTFLADAGPVSVATLFDLKLSKKSGFTRMWQLSQLLDIVLLCTLFFHKNTLKRFYLWDDQIDKSSNTRKTTTTTINIESNNSNKTDSKVSKFFAKTRERILSCFRNQLPPKDYYSPMFYCDLVGMIIVIIFYNSFGESTRSDVVQALKENKVPTAFLVLLFVQFIFTVIDRAIYLTRHRNMKLIFLIIQVVVVHIWLFFVLPMMKKRAFVHNRAAQFWYIVRCAYFAVSAMQFKSGYPTCTTSTVFSQSYDRLHKYLFKLLLAVPFMFEIRSLMGWIWTDTCLNLSSWIQVEDIYSNLYVLKCERDIEKEHPQPYATKRSKTEKYINGGLLFIVIVSIIWFPLMLFSLSSSFYQANPPTVVEIDMQFPPYPSTFSFYVRNESITALTKFEYSQLYKQYIFEKGAYEFLRDFRPVDISKVKVSVDSVLQWSISPVALKTMVEALDKRILTHRVKCSIYRHQLDDDGVFPAWRKVHLDHIVNIGDKGVLNNLKTMLMAPKMSVRNTTLSNAFPKYIYMKGNSEAVEIDALKKPDPKTISAFYDLQCLILSYSFIEIHKMTFMIIVKEKLLSVDFFVWKWKKLSISTIFILLSILLPVDGYYMNLTYILHRRSNQLFWQVFDDTLRRTNHNGSSVHSAFEFYIFTDRISPDSISFITKYGIFGIYTTFVLVAGSVIRSMTQKSAEIMYEELPNVNRLLQICLDIYLVRERKMFDYEELLFSKLIFIYRSPETLIEITADPEE